MADYYTQTVFQENIPNADMTALEFLLLSNIFESEPEGDETYFFSEMGANDFVYVKKPQLRKVLDASQDYDSHVKELIETQLSAASSGDDEIELDMSATSWEFIIQDIVRRSPTLEYIEVVAAFTCSKMRSDGFGGMAIFVTATDIKYCSTTDFLATCLAEFEAGKKEG